MLRYLLLILIVYFVIKSVGKLLVNLKIVDTDSAEVKGESESKSHHLHVDEADIEDADFKDVD